MTINVILASLNTISRGEHRNAMNRSFMKRRTLWRNICKNRTVNFLKLCILNSIMPLIMCTKFQINQHCFLRCGIKIPLRKWWNAIGNSVNVWKCDVLDTPYDHFRRCSWTWRSIHCIMAREERMGAFC